MIMIHVPLETKSRRALFAERAVESLSHIDVRTRQSIERQTYGCRERGVRNWAVGKPFHHCGEERQALGCGQAILTGADEALLI
jgi:hypothetical protein